MIARNEAENLPAMARAVRHLIDSWIIVIDPRTTDNTEAVAHDVFAGIQGRTFTSKLTEATFNFGAARDEAQALASESGVHLMWLDPDTPPVGHLPADISAPVYFCEVRDEFGWTWQWPLLVRSDCAGPWHLPAHEVLEIRAPIGTWQKLDTIYLQRSGSGTNTARIEWSIDALRKAADEGNSDSPRAMFYLGQMLTAVDRNKEALEAYIKRVGMGGADAEEQFFSFIRIGELLVQPDMLDLPKASRALLDAYALRPHRSESLFYLAHIANTLRNHEMALAFANQGLMLPPSRDLQFTMRWIEQWGMKMQWAVAAHELGNGNSPAVISELLERADVPDNWRVVLERYENKELSLREGEVKMPTLPNWFEMGAVQYFKALLTPLAGQPNLNFLQIGVFAGDASSWMLASILTGEGSHLDDVDTWGGSEDIHDIDFRHVEQWYDSQTAPYADHVEKHKTTSTEFLRTIPLAELYDFIYIDGDHTAAGCLSDAVGAWPRLKVGGLLAFDDYTWRDALGRPLHAPYPAIDAFMAIHADRCEVVGDGAQIWLRKTG